MLGEIRQAMVKDVPALFHVRTSVAENVMTEADLATIGITHQSVAKMLDSGEARAWCAEEDASIVGFALAIQDSREISGLFVLPEWTNRGIGSLLLAVATSWLWEHGNGPIRLSADPRTPAYDFYKRRGWKDLGFGPTAEPLADDVYLELRKGEEGRATDA